MAALVAGISIDGDEGLTARAGKVLAGRPWKIHTLKP
jgi:hypothetical protein